MILQFHAELIKQEQKGAYHQGREASVSEANVGTIVGIFCLALVAVVLAGVLIFLLVHTIRKGKRDRRKNGAAYESSDPAAEQLKALEADRDRQNGWTTGSQGRSGSGSKKSGTVPVEKRKLKTSSIEEEQREPDEVDSSLHDVYKDTTMPQH